MKKYCNCWDNFWRNYKLESEPVIHKDEFPITEIPKHKKILEIGCGAGRVLNYFFKNGYDIYGIDISQVALRALKKRFYGERQDISSRVCLCDCTHLSFSDKSFGTTVCLGVLEHYDNHNDIKCCLNEIKRVLSDDGIAVISLPHKFSAFIFVEMFKRLTRRWHSGTERKFLPWEFIHIAETNEFKCLGYYTRPMDITPAKGLQQLPAFVLRILDRFLVKFNLGGHMVTYIFKNGY